MSELSELYQQVILDHNKHPRNFGRLATANRTAEGYNPLCGDHITLYVELDGDLIRDIAFEGSGCAVSKASASMMTEALKGRRLEEADALFESFRGLVTGKNDGAGDAAGVGGVAGAAGTHSGAGERSARGTAETGEGSTDASGNRSAIRGTAGIRSADRGVGTAGTAVALGKLAVFSGVGEFPMRVKCATLAWHTLRAALEGKHEPVSTE